MTTTHYTMGPNVADSMNDAVRAAAEASLRTVQSGQDAARLSRELFAQSADAGRKLFTAYAEGLTAGFKTGFGVESAALSAGLTVLEATGTGTRQLAGQFVETLQKSQHVTLDAWQAGARALSLAAGDGTS